MPEINQDLFEQLQNLTSNFQGLNRELNPLLDIEKEHNKNLKKTQDQLKDFGKQAVTTGKALYDATMSINEGTAKYGAAVKGAAGMAGDLAGQFGIFGKVIGTVIKAFGGLAASSLEQNERLVKFTQRVSEFGAIDFSGVEGLSESLKRAGLTSDLLEVFEKSLKNFGGTLGALGGTAAKGTKRFSDVMGNVIGGEFERDLRKLGYTTDGIYEVASKYIDRETKYGNVSRRNNEQITEGLKRYYNELEAVTRLTGMNRQEQEEIRRQNREQIRFNDYLEGLQGPQKAAVENFTTILSDVEPEFRQGMIDLIVNNGALVSNEAIKVFQATRGQFLPIFKQIEAGAMDPVKGLQLLGKQFDIQYKQTKNIVAQNEQGIRVMGLSNKIVAFGRRVQEMSTIEQVKRDLEESKQADGRLNEEAKRVQEERKNQRLRNEILEMTGNTLVKVMTSVSEVMTFFGKTVAKMIDKFGPYVGLGQTNLESLFVTNAEEAKEVLVSTQEKLAKILDQRGRLEKELESAIKAKETATKDAEKYKDIPGLRTMAENNRKGWEALEKAAKDKLAANKKDESDTKKVIKNLENISKNTEKKEAKPALSAGGGRGVQGGPTAEELSRSKTKEKSDSGKIEEPAELKTGGSLSWRNNNPGNLRFSKWQEQFGGKPGQGGFAQFPSVEQGDAARKHLLFDKSMKYAKATLKEMINMYAPASDNNDPNSYLQYILSGLPGANPDTRLQDLNEQQKNILLDRMKSKEGWKPGNIAQGATGGVFAGPGSGYPVMLHGNEMVIPLKEEAITSPVTKTELPKPTVATAPIRENNFEMALAPLIERVDSLISEIIAQKRVQEDLLHITRATV